MTTTEAEGPAWVFNVKDPNRKWWQVWKPRTLYKSTLWVPQDSHGRVSITVDLFEELLRSAGGKPVD